MATKPKPKPKPKPPDPDEDEAARKLHDAVSDAVNAATKGISLVERVENLENRMDKLEAEAKEPPIRLGRRA